jgi:hypothetical protein
MRNCTVSLNIQNLTGCNLVAKLVGGGALAFREQKVEKYSVDVSEAPLRLVLKQDCFKEQCIKIQTATPAADFVTVFIKKEFDYPEIKMVSNPNKVKHASLYKTRVGGGDSFVIAIGNTNDDVSMEKVRSVQKDGKKQIYTKMQ